MADLEIFGHVLHPGARLAAPDEAVDILDLWINEAFESDDFLRFARMLQMREEIAPLDWGSDC